MKDACPCSPGVTYLITIVRVHFYHGSGHEQKGFTFNGSFCFSTNMTVTPYKYIRELKQIRPWATNGNQKFNFLLLTPFYAIISLMASHQTSKQELSSPRQVAETCEPTKRTVDFQLPFMAHEHLRLSSLLFLMTPGIGCKASINVLPLFCNVQYLHTVKQGNMQQIVLQCNKIKLVDDISQV